MLEEAIAIDEETAAEDDIMSALLDSMLLASLIVASLVADALVDSELSTTSLEELSSPVSPPPQEVKIAPMQRLNAVFLKSIFKAMIPVEKVKQRLGLYGLNKSSQYF